MLKSLCYGVELWFLSILILLLIGESEQSPTYSQIPQEQVTLPVKRLPYYHCSRTKGNLWECITKYTTVPNTVPENHGAGFEITEMTTSTTTTLKPSISTATSTPCPPTTTIKDQTSLDSVNEANKNSSLLLFEDNFDTFDLDKWEHEITMAGGGNWEFQIYVNNRSNSFVKDGMLHIRPTLTADVYGEDFLSNGRINLNGGSPADQCTYAEFDGCDKFGNPTNILNPVISAKLRTVAFDYAFTYGRVEIRAKFPSGNWLRPAISLLPYKYQYGRWPASGEIHMAESRGNKDLYGPDGESIGINQITSSLDFGPFFPSNMISKEVTQFSFTADKGFDENFHIFEMEWTPRSIKFLIDGNETGIVEPLDDGFWGLGQFPNNLHNPWETAENRRMAPFDQKFYIAISLAVGGTNGFFPESVREFQPEVPPANRQISSGFGPENDTDSTGPKISKPWSDSSNMAYKEFWDARAEWLPTWKNSVFMIDYVRVYKLEDSIQILDL